MMRCSGANLTPACLVVPVKAERRFNRDEHWGKPGCHQKSLGVRLLPLFFAFIALLIGVTPFSGNGCLILFLGVADFFAGS